MRDLFERLQQEGEAGIQRLVDERTQEMVTLDFKLKADPTKGAFDKEDRATLGRLLSAFANSAGGLLVWGIDARKVDGVDCAQSAVPIHDIARFQSEALGQVGQLLQPRHDGIYIAHVPSAQAGAGYLLVFVERSERRPHRCEAKDRKQYFKRSGDSTFEMEHYDVEDAFRRAVMPSLQIECRSQKGSTATSPGKVVYTIYFELSLFNNGLVTAKFPYLNLKAIVGVVEGVYPNASGLFGLTDVGVIDGWRCFAGGADTVIHPGHRLPVARMRTDYVQLGEGPVAINVASDINPGWVKFLAQGGCENARTADFDYEADRMSINMLLYQLPG